MVYLTQLLIKRNKMKKVVIPDFPNYTISENGIVMNGEREKAQTLGPQGYKYVTLYKDNKSKKLTIHRLLMLAFVDNPEGKRTVNHKDGNKLNNSLDNLEWNTDAENIQHAYSSGLYKNRAIDNKSLRKDMYNRFMGGDSLMEISKDFPVALQTIRNYIAKHVKENSLEKEYKARARIRGFDLIKLRNK